MPFPRRRTPEKKEGWIFCRLCDMIEKREPPLGRVPEPEPGSHPFFQVINVRKAANPPVYSQVAYDIATKIAVGTLPENTKFSGRSLMSTEYGVSQETIRRAMNLLADMGIIQIQNNSGAVVISRERATQYIDKFQSEKNTRAMKSQLRALIAERDRLNERIFDLVEKLTDLNDRFRYSDPMRNYEFTIPAGSHLIGMTVKESEFRQSTRASIVAIRSNGQINLTPGPNDRFQEGDLLVVSCSPALADEVKYFIQQRG